MNKESSKIGITHTCTTCSYHVFIAPNEYIVKETFDIENGGQQITSIVRISAGLDGDKEISTYSPEGLRVIDLFKKNRP